MALEKFLDTFVCQANQAGVGYFFFEVGVWFQLPFLNDIAFSGFRREMEGEQRMLHDFGRAI
jgi:hypothetical protein